MAVLTNFHIVFLVPKQDGDDLNVCLSLQSKLFDEVLFDWRRNYGSRKYPVYRPLCTFVRKYVNGRLRSNFDLHYVNPALSFGGEADVAFYVTKYMLKSSNRLVRLQQALRLNLSEDEYEDVWKLVRTRHFESEGFGLGTSDFVLVSGHKVYSVPGRVVDYLRSGIERSKIPNGVDDPVPSFFSPVDGSSHPLAKYYKSRGEVFHMKDFLDFFYSSKKIGSDNFIPEKELDNQTDQAIDKFEKNVSLVEFSSTVSNLDDLFDGDFDNQFLDFQ